MSQLKILSVVGARPNFMKIAPICDALQKYSQIESCLVHTGQHYDEKMSDLFFNHLGLPKPDYYLGVGSGGHGYQTGTIMVKFEDVLQETAPDIVLVVGDVNSTIACGLDAVKAGIKLVHVEAGLRSYDRDMPEEINRVLTDQISDYLFITERSARDNLLKEGIDHENIHFVGNVMIDSLLKHREKAKLQPVLSDLHLESKQFCLVTLHRPSNVDNKTTLTKLIETLLELSKDIKVVFPVHPRTRLKLSELGLEKMIESHNMLLIEPQGYLEFLNLSSNSLFVLTDSGGIQEETTVLGVPCITARKNTERPITCDEGTNVLVGEDNQLLLKEARTILDGRFKKGGIPELWDGCAAERIVEILWEKEGKKQTK